MDLERLQRPISGSAPCGVDLSDSQVLLQLGNQPIFGQPTPEFADVDWNLVVDRAGEVLEQSKHLAALAYYGIGILRTEGLGPFVDVLETAVTWLRDFWDDVYPVLEEDALLRQSALSGFADRMAVVDALRRTPLVSQRQFGTYSLRDVEIASGAVTAPAGEEDAAAPARIDAAFAAMPAESLVAVEAQIGRGIAAARAIEQCVADRASRQDAPDLAPLVKTLDAMRQTLTRALEGRRNPGTASATDVTGDEGGGTQAAVAVGAIRTREDAVRALEAVADFFRRNEPSSPVPLFAERTRRLITMDFVELLNDIAPGGLAEARRAAGIKDHS